MEEKIEKINNYLSKTSLDKMQAKKLAKLMNKVYGTNFGGCMCSSIDREELQVKVKEYLNGK